MRARLDGASQLMLDTIPMHCKFNPDYCTGAEPTAGLHGQGVEGTLAIHRGEERRQDLSRPFLRSQERPCARRLPANVELVAATPEDFSYVMRDDIMGFDDHGGPYWHYALYSRIHQSFGRH